MRKSFRPRARCLICFNLETFFKRITNYIKKSYFPLILSHGCWHVSYQITSQFQETSFSFTYDPNAKRLKPKLKIKSQDSWDIYRQSCHPITGLSVTSCDIMLHTAAKTTRHAARHRAVRAWAPDPVWTLPYWCAYYVLNWRLTENYEHRCLTPLKSASSIYTVVNKQSLYDFFWSVSGTRQVGCKIKFH